MPSSSRRPPSLLETRLRYVAQQYRRRRQLVDRLKFTAAFVVALLLLGVGVSLVEVLSLPFFIPFILVLPALVFLWRRWIKGRDKEIDPTQIALLIDALHPELENLTISGVEFGRPGYQETSDWIVEQVRDAARTETGRLDLDDLVDPRPLRRLVLGSTALWLAGFALLGFLLHSWDLERIGSGFFSASPFRRAVFSVEPGDVRVRRDADQIVWVDGASPGQSGAIRWRSGPGDWATNPLEPGAEEVYYFRLRDLRADTEYQVQIGRQRSRVYRIAVWSPPAVESIDLTYHYPDYLGLPPREVIDSGPIAAPPGTTVRLEVLADEELSQAVLQLASGASIPLSVVEPRRWQGEFTLTRDDQYSIALRDVDGDESESVLPYPIVAEVDDPPEIRVESPRGDDEATAIEEVSFGFVVSDDYGLKGYGLQFELAGRPPVRVPLHTPSISSTEAVGEYLLALEEWELASGDLITWTVWAEDHKPGRPSYEVLGDPYFLEIRPFQRTFGQAVSNQGGAAGSGGSSGGSEAADQKQIIIATWNLRRGASDLGVEEFTERRDAIVAAQQQVLQAALGNSPPPGKEFLVTDLQEEVRAALEQLVEAVLPEPAPSLSQALVHQQRAYRALLQMESAHSQVVQGGRDAGSGQGSARRRELDGLETARRRDFSERASTLQEQLEATRQARSDIEELVRRQEFINRDIARLVSEGAEQDEEEEQENRRQLERLREEQRRNLDDLDALGGRVASGDLDAEQARRASQRLDQARRQMQRGAQDLASGQPQRARAAGGRALEALRQVDDDLGHLSRSAAAERFEQLGRQMDGLRNRQAELADSIRSLRDRRGRELESVQRQVEEIIEEKEALAGDFSEFMDEAGELAEKSASSQDLMARKLGDWLRRTSGRFPYEDLLQGGQYARYGLWEQAAELEEELVARLDTAAAGLDSVAAYLVENGLDAREKALEQLRRVMQAGGAVADGQLLGDSTDAYGWGPRTPEELRRFAEGGYRDWMEALRSAEELLPDDSGSRAGLAGVRQGIGSLGRRYEREGTLPRYDLVFDTAIKPLTLAAEGLGREIGRLRGERDQPTAYGDEIPARYREHVAEYFEKLSQLGDD